MRCKKEWVINYLMLGITKPGYGRSGLTLQITYLNNRLVYYKDSIEYRVFMQELKALR